MLFRSVLAARLREKGYRLYQAPQLAYELSVSGEQDSVSKLLRHQWLFGRTTPYIVLAVPGSAAGLVGAQAGSNRKRRALLRLAEIAGSVAWPLVLVGLALGWPAWVWAAALGLVVALKLALQARHIALVRFSAGELLGYALLQPLLDVAYAAGILEGLGRTSWTPPRNSMIATTEAQPRSIDVG